MDDKYTHKEGLVYLNQYHIIFCPKYRRKVLVDDIERDLREIFHIVAEEKQVEIKALEIMPDHVQLVISFGTRQPLHELIKAFKGRSSKMLRAKYPKLKSRIPSLWTNSYFSCTIGHISEETMQQYLDNQKRS